MLTWAEFKAEMEKQGVKNEHFMSWVDVDGGKPKVTFVRLSDGTIMVRVTSEF